MKRANPTRKNIWPFDGPKATRGGNAIPATGGIAARMGKRPAPMTKSLGSYKGYIVSRTPDGEYFSSLDRGSYYETYAKLKKSIDDYQKGRTNPRKFDKCVKDVKAKGGAVNAYAVCTAAGTRGKRNPAAEAIAGYEEFHGRPSTKVTRVVRDVHSHEHLSEAGKLIYLKVITMDGKYLVTMDQFKGSVLAFNERKNQLFVEGGDQRPNFAHFGIKRSELHELETLGKVKDIGYHTTKDHLGDEGGKATYDHTFRMTNENGRHVVVKIARYPDLIYRVLDEQLEFSGGSYVIRAEGVDK